MMAWRVGQKAVCIVGDEWLNQRRKKILVRHPSKNEVLTVREVLHYEVTGEYLVFSELGHDSGYKSEHFRPVVSRPTSIAIFQAMLNPTHKRVDA